jgi:hypothetical protein
LWRSSIALRGARLVNSDIYHRMTAAISLSTAPGLLPACMDGLITPAAVRLTVAKRQEIAKAMVTGRNHVVCFGVDRTSACTYLDRRF